MDDWFRYVVMIGVCVGVAILWRIARSLETIEELLKTETNPMTLTSSSPEGERG